MVFTKKEDTEPQNKRIKKSKAKFYNELLEEEFMITLQKTEDGQYELTEEQSNVFPINDDIDYESDFDKPTDIQNEIRNSRAKIELSSKDEKGLVAKLGF